MMILYNNIINVPRGMGGGSPTPSTHQRYISSAASSTTTSTTSSNHNRPTTTGSSKTTTTQATTTPPTTTTTIERPFTILGLQQIAIGCAEREPLHHLWYTIFGLQPSEQNIQIESENVCEDIIRLGGATNTTTTDPVSPTAIEIDLMTPIDPEKSPKVSVCIPL
jgi:hypothetical protein